MLSDHQSLECEGIKQLSQYLKQKEHCSIKHQTTVLTWTFRPSKTCRFVEWLDGPGKDWSWVRCCLLVISPWCFVLGSQMGVLKCYEFFVVWSGRMSNPQMISSERVSVLYHHIVWWIYGYLWTGRKIYLHFFQCQIGWHGYVAPSNRCLDVNAQRRWPFSIGLIWFKFGVISAYREGAMGGDQNTKGKLTQMTYNWCHLKKDVIELRLGL